MKDKETPHISAQEVATINNGKIHSIFINTKWWFDSTGGQPYFSSRIFIDGDCVTVLPFQNGSVYEMPQYEAVKALRLLGLADFKNASRVLWHINEGRTKSDKIALYSAVERVTKSECKKWAQVTL